MSERLTTKFPGGHDAFGMPMATTYDLDLQSAEGRIKARCTLGRIEDILFDESGAEVISFDRLREIAAAERDGRVVVLPIREGEKVYENRMGEVEVAYGYTQPQFDTFAKRFCLSDFHKLGKTVFLTRAEAEAALAGKGAEV